MAGLLEGKIALVTGAASGIGRATSLVMAREGARVVVSDINAEGGEETLSAIKDLGGQGIFIHADVSKAEDVRIGGRCGGDLRPAGLRLQQRRDRRLHGGPASRIPGSWDRLIDINLKASGSA